MTSRARANLIGGVAVALALVGGFGAGAWRHGAFDAAPPAPTADPAGTKPLAPSTPFASDSERPIQRPAPIPASLDSTLVFGALTRFPSAAGGLVFIPRPQGETGKAETAQEAWRQGDVTPQPEPEADAAAAPLSAAAHARPTASAPLPPPRPPFMAGADSATTPLSAPLSAPLPPPRPTQLASLGLPALPQESPLLAPAPVPVPGPGPVAPSPRIAPDPAPPKPASGPFTKGSAAFVRIFKREGQLELWLKRDDRYALYKTFAICKWSGKLGPKLREGDHQSPEGFYNVTARQLNPNSTYHLAFNIGFPNAFDRQNGRTGSALMVHGDCVSVGCYAMTDKGIEEIYSWVEAALRGGQREVPVHIFPFRMTDRALAFETGGSMISSLFASRQNEGLRGFWQNLKEGYDLFEKTGEPPQAYACNKRYMFNASGAGCARIAGW